MHNINNIFNQPYMGQGATATWNSLLQVETKPSGKIGEAFVANKAGKNGSHVVLIIDESGSMGHLTQATISSANEFISGQRNDARDKNIYTNVSIYTFDGNSVRCIRNNVNVFEVAELTNADYRPNAMTNLHDALGSVIATINNQLKEKNEEFRPSVIIALLTDGGENASRTFDLRDIHQMYTKCSEANWGFVFMGANIDAFAVGSQMGFNTHNTVQYAATSSGVAQTSAAATRIVNSMKSSFRDNENVDVSTMYASVGFTDEERTRSMGGNNE